MDGMVFNVGMATHDAPQMLTQAEMDEIRAATRRDEIDWTRENAATWQGRQIYFRHGHFQEFVGLDHYTWAGAGYQIIGSPDWWESFQDGIYASNDRREAAAIQARKATQA